MTHTHPLRVPILKTLATPVHILLLAGCALLAACSSEGDDTPTTPAPEVVTPTARPTDWVPVTEDVDLRTSMIVDARIDLSPLGLTYQSHPDDLVAAFVDGTCRAVASPSDATEQTLFCLLVKKLNSDAAGITVTLKLYAARQQRIYTAQPFTFQPDGQLGNIDVPYVPQWK